jgi:hypothetical protein
MRTLFYAICIGLVACGPQQKNDSGKTAKEDKETVKEALPSDNLFLQTPSFERVDSGSVIMLPLGMEENERGSGKYYKEIPHNAYWNIVFYDSKTGATHLLSEQKMLIHNHNVKYMDEEKALPENRYIFYTITTVDFNGDKRFDNEDPEYLFITDKQGHNLRQVSPPNCKIGNWEYIRASNKLLMNVRKDSDGNKKFESTDELSAFEVPLDGTFTPREIISPELKTKLKQLYDRDWRKKEGE